jgi:ubiquinone/menaquinone biosynthesis C-methylase UbiE
VRAETAGFERASHEYERGRPGYPADAVAFIVETAGLGAGRTVVDLAAGTGKLTRELVGSGASVIAVEPLDAMRARLVELLPGVVAVRATAEATGLATASADAVTVAQAFHWFAGEDALSEIQRVLRPGGLLFLLWNRRDVGNPVQAAIGRLTAPHIGAAPSYGSGQWQEVMTATTRFEAVAEHHSGITQELDRQGIVDRVGSTSYIANLSDEVRLPLLEEIAALVPAAGTVSLPYLADAYAFRRL